MELLVVGVCVSLPTGVMVVTTANLLSSSLKQYSITFPDAVLIRPDDDHGRRRESMPPPPPFSPRSPYISMFCC
jgi:hypothetical protein